MNLKRENDVFSSSTKTCTATTRKLLLIKLIALLMNLLIIHNLKFQIFNTIASMNCKTNIFLYYIN